MALLGAAAIYSGFNLVLASMLGGGVSALAFSVVREAGAIVLLYTWAAVAEAPLVLPDAAHRWHFVALGFILAIFQMCFATGVALTDAQTAAVFQCIEPTTAALLGGLLGEERLSCIKLLSALFAGAGVLLIELTSPRASSSADAHGSSTSVPMLPPSPPADSLLTPGVERAIGCTLLFLQGVGIACFCMLQRRLALIPHRDAREVVPVTRVGTVTSGADVGRESDIVSDGAAEDVCAVINDACERPDASSHSTSHSSALAYGPVTVTAHAYASSLTLLLVMAGVDSALRMETPAPLSLASLRRLVSTQALVTVAYAVVLTSCVGYSLRAWADLPEPARACPSLTEPDRA